MLFKKLMRAWAGLATEYWTLIDLWSLRVGRKVTVIYIDLAHGQAFRRGSQEPVTGLYRYI